MYLVAHTQGAYDPSRGEGAEQLSGGGGGESPLETNPVCVTINIVQLC